MEDLEQGGRGERLICASDKRNAHSNAIGLPNGGFHGREIELAQILCRVAVVRSGLFLGLGASNEFSDLLR